MTTKNYNAHIGIDVDKKSYSFTVYHKEMKKSKKIPANPEHLLNYIKKQYPDKNILFAYEAGPTGYHLYDYLTSHHCDCWIISPSSIPKAPNSRVKNNRIDSQTIVKHLQAGNIQSNRVPAGVYRHLRHLVKIREKYTCKRKKSRQRIQALLLFEHLYGYINESDRKWSQQYIQQIKKIFCEEPVRLRLDMLLQDLEYARKQLLFIHRQIRAFVEKHTGLEKNIEYLRSIPGIGFITATSILGKIGDPLYLKNERELAGFTGLIPQESSTGDNIQRGPITHLGNGNLRRLLVEASWIAIRFDTQLYQFYYRIKNRNHPLGGAKKAIVAVARKLTQRIYRVLKDQRKYVIH